MSLPIQSTQKLMFAQNPNYTFNNPHHYQHPVTQQQTVHYGQHPKNYQDLTNMIQQPIYKNPHVQFKPNVVINPNNSNIVNKPCNCQRIL
jgi:hypothetical protein